MLNKTEKDIKRIHSYSAGLRSRQDDAAKASKSNNKVPEKPAPITEGNTDAFIAQALNNGLDLATISAAAKKTNTEK